VAPRIGIAFGVLLTVVAAPGAARADLAGCVFYCTTTVECEISDNGLLAGLQRQNCDFAVDECVERCMADERPATPPPAAKPAPSRARIEIAAVLGDPVGLPGVAPTHDGVRAALEAQGVTVTKDRPVDKLGTHVIITTGEGYAPKAGFREVRYTFDRGRLEAISVARVPTADDAARFGRRVRELATRMDIHKSDAGFAVLKAPGMQVSVSTGASGGGVSEFWESILPRRF
jgi:hypothetical protein